MSSDRIEKHVVLKASRSRVWRAVTDYKEFGTWFKAKMENPFVVGQRSHGQVTHPGYEHLRMDVLVERMDPEHTFTIRWHPGTENPKPGDPTTLVEFKLEEVPEGTRLTVIESGFDKLPPERRAEVFRGNEFGWIEQMKNIEAYIDG